MQWRWVMVCAGLSGCMFLCSDDAIDRILTLREKQVSSTYSSYVAYDNDIHEIKSQYTDAPKREGRNTLVAYVHVLPLIVWQILGILLAIGLGIYLPSLWRGQYIVHAVVLGISLGIVGYAVWLGVYERDRKCAIVHAQHVPLHIGPAQAYPISGYCKYLDEVEVQELLEDWVKVRYADTYGWIQQNALTWVIA